VGWEHDADSMRKIPAVRCNKETLDRVFKTDVRFLTDQHGEVIYPHEFAAKLQVAPYCYFIHPWRVTHSFLDAEMDTSYLGGTALLLINVPHGLCEEDLRAWFRAGIVGGDLEVVDMTKKIQRAGTFCLSSGRRWCNGLGRRATAGFLARQRARAREATGGLWRTP
jgi:hypothetical protein